MAARFGFASEHKENEHRLPDKQHEEKVSGLPDRNLTSENSTATTALTSLHDTTTTTAFTPIAINNSPRTALTSPHSPTASSSATATTTTVTARVIAPISKIVAYPKSRIKSDTVALALALALSHISSESEINVKLDAECHSYVLLAYADVLASGPHLEAFRLQWHRKRDRCEGIDEVVEALAEAIRKSSTLTSLHLGMECFEEWSILEVAKAFGGADGNSSVKDLELLRPSYYEKSKGRVQGVLERSVHGSSYARAWAEILESNTQLNLVLIEQCVRERSLERILREKGKAFQFHFAAASIGLRASTNT